MAPRPKMCGRDRSRQADELIASRQEKTPGRGRGLRVVLGAGEPRRGQVILRFSADVLPRLVTSSYSTTWPSLSEVKPARSTAEMWTNTSLSPVDGRMKP